MLDLQRFLTNVPVSVGPPSRWYAARKFVRRNRGAVLAASLIAVALVAGIIVATFGLVEARRQERIAADEKLKALESQKAAVAEAERANREAETADEVAGFLTGLFEPRDRLVISAANLGFRGKAASSLRAHDILAQGVERLNSPAGLKKHPLVRARLLYEIAAIYFSLGDSAAATPLAEKSLRILREKLPGDHPDLVKSLRLVAQLTFLDGDYQKCIDLHREAIAILEQQPGDAALLDRAETEASLSMALGLTNLKESLRLVRRAYETYEKALGPNDLRTISTGWLRVVIEGENVDAAFVAQLQQRLENSKANADLLQLIRLGIQARLASSLLGERQATELWRDLVRQLTKVFGDQHPLTYTARRSYADKLYHTTRQPAVTEELRARIRDMLDDLKAGREFKPLEKDAPPLQEAARLYAEGMTGGPRWERNANRFNLARVLMRCNLNDDAERLLTEALAEFRKQPPELNRDYVPHALQLLAWVNNRPPRDGSSVERLFQEALVAAKANPQTSPDRLGDAFIDLGHYRLNHGRPAEAVPLFAEAVEVMKAKGSDYLRTIWAMAWYESALRKCDRIAEADAVRQKIQAHADKYTGSRIREAREIVTLLSGQLVGGP
jgi:hypothetical protein